MARARAYGTEVSVSTQGFPSQCGGTIVHNFNVGRNNNLDKEQRGHLYDLLMIDVMRESRDFGLLVATDVTQDNPNNKNGWAPTDSGYCTLEEFCDHHEFNRSDASLNTNSHNYIRSWAKAMLTKDEAGNEFRFAVKAPKLLPYDEDEMKKKEQEKALELLAAMAKEARNNG